MIEEPADICRRRGRICQRRQWHRSSRLCASISMSFSRHHCLEQDDSSYCATHSHLVLRVPTLIPPTSSPPPPRKPRLMISRLGLSPKSTRRGRRRRARSVSGTVQSSLLRNPTRSVSFICLSSQTSRLTFSHIPLDASSEMADLSNHFLRSFTRQSQTHPHRDLRSRACLPSFQRRL